MFLNNSENAVFACPGVGYKADYLRLVLTSSCHSLDDLIGPVFNEATWSPSSPPNSNSWVICIYWEKKHNKQLFTSGNNDNPLHSGSTKLLYGIIYTPLRQNSGLFQTVHLAVRQAAVCPSQLEAPSSPHPLLLRQGATEHCSERLPPLVLPQKKVLRRIKRNVQFDFNYPWPELSASGHFAALCLPLSCL